MLNGKSLDVDTMSTPKGQRFKIYHLPFTI